MIDLNEWWSRLPEDDRNLFIEHRNTKPLPADVVERARRSGEPTTAAVWVCSPDNSGFEWRYATQQFLEARAREREA
jgi:hypothetical protein